MAPKTSKSRRAQNAGRGPHALYKRALTAIRSWTPPEADAHDVKALACLAAAAEQLQQRLGYPVLPPAATSAAADGAQPCPASDGSSDAAMASGDGVAAEGAMRRLSGLACSSPLCDPLDSPALAAVWPAVARLDAAVAAYPGGPAAAAGGGCAAVPVRHSLDLELGDEEDDEGRAFLLAACHTELGRLMGRMWTRRAGARTEPGAWPGVGAAAAEGGAQQGAVAASPGAAGEVAHLRAALALFPDYVAGSLALAQSLLSCADSTADLREAEVLLRRAVAVAERLAGAQGDPAGDGNGSRHDSDTDLPLADANAACRRECKAGDEARRALAMLLCQQGRDDEAAGHLKQLGYTHRLARQVLHYPLDTLMEPSEADGQPHAAAPDDSQPPARSWASAVAPEAHQRYVCAVDGALPPALLEVLRGALSPGSPFWREHGYGRVGYFSYMHQLDGPCLSAIHQAAELLRRLAVERFPAVAEAKYAEWWAHCRRHPAGHQLHFDSDDEGAGGVRNPIVSTVVYLTGGVGGPTLVTPQVLGGPLAPHGWIVHPRDNRVAMFDATFLHGVIPGRGASPRPGDHRITLMVAFWRELTCRPRQDQLPGPSQPFPRDELTSPAASSTAAMEAESGPAACGTCRYSWMADLPPHPDGPDGWGAASPQDVRPVALGGVWERLDGTAAQPGAVTYDVCFQGF